MLFNTTLPEFCQEGIIRTEGPDKLDASCPPAGMIDDQEPPAPVIPTDLRPGEMNGTIRLLTSRLMPEKRAGMRQFFKDALVIEESTFVRIYGYRGLFTGIIVIDKETVVPVLFLDDMYIAELIAAFPALEAFEDQGGSPLNNGPTQS